MLDGALLLAICMVLGACTVSSPRPDTQAATRWCDRLPRTANAALERVAVSGNWFEVYRVAPAVYAIHEPMQWQEVTSFLILGEARALLFDTGMGIEDIHQVVQELTVLPVVVLNSHTHADHIGGNASFTHILALDTAFTRQRTKGIAHEHVREEVAPEALCRPLPAGVAERFRIHPFEVTEWITEGHSIDLGGRQLEVLSIPGHTPDAVALFDAEAGFLWTGDSFYEGPIYLMAPETDLEAYARSVSRLASLVPRLNKVFPGHNTVTVAPSALTALEAAMAQVRTGTADGTDRGDGTTEFSFDSFSLLVGVASW